MASELYGRAARFAIERHGEQVYGGNMPYQVHLGDVVNVLREFVPWERLSQDMVDAAWLHDVIEDTNTTLERVGSEFGDETARLVHAVTNEPGKNRKERHAKTYPKVRATRCAIIVKLADRIANVRQSIAPLKFGQPVQGLFWMYAKEWSEFKRELHGPNTSCLGLDDIAETMWEELMRLMDVGYASSPPKKSSKQSGSSDALQQAVQQASMSIAAGGPGTKEGM